MLKKLKYRRVWSLEIDENIWKEFEIIPEDNSVK
jgi:hypothetical protein